MWDFGKGFFFIYWDDYVILVASVYKLYYIYWFAYDKLSLHSNFIVVYDLLLCLLCCWTWSSSILLMIFASMFIKEIVL
jgi:hypothetical protein